MELSVFIGGDRYIHVPQRAGARRPSVAAQAGVQPATLADSADEMSRWAHDALGAGHAALVDHSGLSDASRVSARDMVDALLAARRIGTLPGLLKNMPMRDEAGNVMPDHPVTIRAKTGTLNFVSALAGYVSVAGGRDMVFAYFSADMDAREAAADSGDEIPAGARSWKGKSRLLQQKLIERWGTAFSA